MSEEVKESKDILRLMEDATSGSREALEAFYSSFLETEFIIIERTSQGSSPREPKYPTEFFPFLGVRGGDKTWLPIFTTVEAANEWSATTPNTTSIKGSEALNRIPNEWWLALNPGAETSKEFSPWEINTLKSGPEGVKAAAEDQMPALVLEHEYTPVSTEDNQALSQKLKTLSQSNEKIDSIRVATERGLDSDNKTVSERILIGIACKQHTSTEQMEEIKESVSREIGTLLIGENSFEVLVGIGHEALSLGRLKEIPPLHEAETKNDFTMAQILLIGLIVIYLAVFIMKI
jgi:hypothetical protein